MTLRKSPWPVAICIVLAGCNAPRDIGADIYELNNMRQSNVVPKSSPTTLIRSFATHCADRIGNPDSMAPALLAADYVAVPSARGNAMRSYVVDDTRPLVMLAQPEDRVICAVAAESRTGQTTRTARFVAETYPGALPVDPARISRQTEAAWLVRRDPDTIIFTQRHGAPSTPATFLIAIQQEKPDSLSGPN